MSNKKTNFGGKGSYIALALCAAAIGLAGYLYTGAEEPQTLQQPDPDVQVMAPTPSVNTQTTPSQEPTQPSVQPSTGKLKTCAPVEGVEVAAYAMEALCYNETTRDWRVHNGVDIAAEAGTKVCAAADGEVYTVYEDERLGTTVVIRHEGGYTTRYSSLAQEVSVAAGDTVTMGQTLGTVGSTALMETALGDHVHFSVSHNDASMDPAEFLAMDE